ncbi:MAG: cytochrome c biogenesis protein CcsA [Hyphomicrobiales bacterium]
MGGFSTLLFFLGFAAVLAGSASYLAWLVSPLFTCARGLTDTGLVVELPGGTRRSERARRTGQLFAVAAVILLGAAILSRMLATHRPPYANLWEYSMALGFGTLLLFLVFERLYGPSGLGVGVLPLVALLFGVAQLAFSSAVEPLVPALQNNRLLAMHVACMLTAYSAMSVAFMASLVYLAQQPGRELSWLPARDLAHTVQDRAIMLGFPLLGFGIVLGAYWGNIAWGRYWGWDPKETTALISWLVYAGYMHARSLGRWRGDRAALISLTGLA